MDRRSVLKAVGLMGAAVVGMAALPRLAWAAYSEHAFKARAAKDALENLYGANATTPSDQVKLIVPPIAENGARVDVEVETDLKADSIAILIEKNPAPLAVSVDLPEGTQAKFKTRCRMGETTNVTAVVQSGGKLYTATKEVKVTIGGCGG
jgi:sulfur-oxidizing protein SoxY